MFSGKLVFTTLLFPVSTISKKSSNIVICLNNISIKKIIVMISANLEIVKL